MGAILCSRPYWATFATTFYLMCPTAVDNNSVEVEKDKLTEGIDLVSHEK